MIQFIGILCAVWLFVEGAYVIEFIKKVLKISNDSNTSAWYQILLQELVNCCLCTGFWVGLIVYKDFWMACIVSLSCEAFYKIVKKLNNFFLDL